MTHGYTRVTIIDDPTPDQCEWLVGFLPDNKALSLTCDDCDALWDGNKRIWSKEGCQEEKYYSSGL
jgi:hypothetical protein